MIQRKQTVHLFIGAGALSVVVFYCQHLLVEGLGWLDEAMAVLAGITALGALYTISMYRVREKQLSAAKLVLLAGLLVAGGVIGGVGMMGLLPTIADHQSLMIPTALSASSVILFALAIRGISKDIKTVRSMDRLR